MACTEIWIYSVAVGQGQMNMAELVDTSTEEPEFLGVYLFDCGGGRGTVREQRELISTVLGRNGNQFKAAFFSHTDSDHANLMSEFKSYFEHCPVYLSCAENSANTYLIGKLNEMGIAGIYLSGTHLATEEQPQIQYLLEDNGVIIRVLLAAARGGANDASAIVCMEIGDTIAVFTGDATAQTFGEAVRIIESMEENQQYFEKKRCHYVAIPHHGSYTTATASDPAMRNLINFGAYITARSGVCSYARHVGWQHGNIQVIRACCNFLLRGDTHTVYITRNSTVPGYQTTDEAYFTNQSKYQGAVIKVSYRHRIFDAKGFAVGCILPNENTANKVDILTMTSWEAAWQQPWGWNEGLQSNTGWNHIQQSEVLGRRRTGKRKIAAMAYT